MIRPAVWLGESMNNIFITQRHRLSSIVILTGMVAVIIIVITNEAI